jgi:hypothetical protein
MPVSKILNITDIDLSFEPNPINKDIMVVKGVKTITGSIKNLLQLNKYDLINTTIAMSVDSSIFELSGSYLGVSSLESIVSNLIERFEPRATNVKVNASILSDSSGFDLTISFIPVLDKSEYSFNYILSNL